MEGGEKINGKILALCLCFLFLFGVASVSAEDVISVPQEDLDLSSDDVISQEISSSDENSLETLASEEDIEELSTLDIDDTLDVIQDESLSNDDSNHDVLTDSVVTINESGPTPSVYIGAKTSNGFTVFCSQHSKSAPHVGSKFIFSNNTSIYINERSKEYVGDYLKIFIYNYADELMGEDIHVNVTKNGVVSEMVIIPEYLMQWIIWGFTNEDYKHPSKSWTEFTYGGSTQYGDLDTNPFVNLTLTYVQKVLDDYNGGQRVPNYAYKKVNETTVQYYEFPAFKASSTSVQSLFGFKMTEYSVGLKHEKIALDEVVNLYDPVRFILKVTNTGDITLSDIYIVDNGTDGLEYLNFIDESHKWSYESNKWVYDGTLDPEETINLTLVFNATKEGDLINQAVTGSDLSNESNSSNTTHVLVSDFEATKVCDDKCVNLGHLVKFTITVKNTGEADLGGVFFEENAPDGLVYESYKNGTGNWNYDNGKFYLDGSLNVGETATLTVIFKVGNFTNQITAGSNQTDNVTAHDTVEVKDVEDNSTQEERVEENSTQEDSVEDNSTQDNSTQEETKNTASKTKTQTVSITSKATGNPIMLLIICFACLIGVRRYK